MVALLTFRSAGFTFCATAALALQARSQNRRINNGAEVETARSEAVTLGESPSEASVITAGLQDGSPAVRWLLARLTQLIEDDEILLDEDDNTEGQESSSAISSKYYTLSTDEEAPETLSFSKSKSCHTPLENGSACLGEITGGHSALDAYTPIWTGMNGRCNKVADSCYIFWVVGSLHVGRSKGHTKDPHRC